MDHVRFAASVSTSLECDSNVVGFDLIEMVLRKAADEHAPTIRSKKRSPRNNPWYTDHIHSERVTRRRFERKYVKSELEIDRQIYLEQCENVVDMIKHAKSQYYRETLSGATSKDMFRITGSLLSNQEKKLPTMASPIELANKFAKLFSEKVAKIRSELDLVESDISYDLETRTLTCKLDHFTPITSEDLLIIVNKSPTESCSSDPIPTWILNKRGDTDISTSCTDEISERFAPGRNCTISF